MNNTNYEAPNYVIISVLLLLLSQIKILSSALCFEFYKVSFCIGTIFLIRDLITIFFSNFEAETCRQMDGQKGLDIMRSFYERSVQTAKANKSVGCKYQCDRRIRLSNASIVHSAWICYGWQTGGTLASITSFFSLQTSDWVFWKHQTIFSFIPRKQKLYSYKSNSCYSSWWRAAQVSDWLETRQLKVTLTDRQSPVFDSDRRSCLNV